MNSAQRQFWFPQIDRKQRIDELIIPVLKTTLFEMSVYYPSTGEYCNWCGLTPRQLRNTGRDPVMCIDHIDNNNSHNEITNLQFLCKSCNRIKNPIKSVLQGRVVKTQSEITNEKESDWREWVMQKVLDHSSIDIDDCINAGAELFGVSPETIERRWYKKITSSAGLFRESKEDGVDVLVLKSREHQKRINAEKELLPSDILEALR